MTGIQRWLPIYVAVKGYYLLPAVAGTLVAARYLLHRAGRGRPMRALLVALAATAAFSVPVYFNFFNYHFGGFVNPHEFFHYYLGSKYAREVGYFDLYNAALVADAETGLLFKPADGQIIDLSTYGYRSVPSVLAEGDLGEIRDLLDRHPRSVRLKARDARGLARELVLLPDLVSLNLEDATGHLLAEIRKPDAFFSKVQELSATFGVEEMWVTDENLESVFSYLVSK